MCCPPGRVTPRKWIFILNEFFFTWLDNDDNDEDEDGGGDGDDENEFKLLPVQRYHWLCTVISIQQRSL